MAYMMDMSIVDDIYNTIEVFKGRDELGSEDWLVTFDDVVHADDFINVINCMGDGWYAVKHKYVVGMVLIARKA